MNLSKSERAYERACKVLVGGVNSPVRSFASVGGTPPFIVKAKGCTITDLDGNSYIDYVGSYGPVILGHAHERVMTAITKAAHHGTSFGAPTMGEVKLAEAVQSALPSIEKIRFVSSGTEAVMSAVRVARGATGRNMIIKCVGGYHGHADCLLVAAGSGAMTLGTPSSPGVPPGAVGDTLLVPFNDLAAAKAALEMHKDQVAAILVEPVAGNMGVVPPKAGYLVGLRDICDQHGTLLIFDEVMTGFRLAFSGAQGLYGVRPDLTTLGKIIGGGMPVGAVGGKAVIMDHLAPVGPVYQAGTLSGNPVAMAAGLATLLELQAEGVYQKLEAMSASLEAGLTQAIKRSGLTGKACINRVGSMLTLFFAPPPVCDYASATQADRQAFGRFFQSMLRSGIYLPPSQFEAWFVSTAHEQADIDRTVQAAERALNAASAGN